MSNFWNKKLFSFYCAVFLQIATQLAHSGVNLVLREGQNEAEIRIPVDQVVFVPPPRVELNRWGQNPFIPLDAMDPNLINLNSPSGKAKLFILCLYFVVLFSTAIKDTYYEKANYFEELQLDTKMYLSFSILTLTRIHYTYLYYPRFRKYYSSFWHLII